MDVHVWRMCDKMWYKITELRSQAKSTELWPLLSPRSLIAEENETHISDIVNSLTSVLSSLYESQRVTVAAFFAEVWLFFFSSLLSHLIFHFFWSFWCCRLAWVLFSWCYDDLKRQASCQSRIGLQQLSQSPRVDPKTKPGDSLHHHHTVVHLRSTRALH